MGNFRIIKLFVCYQMFEKLLFFMSFFYKNAVKIKKTTFEGNWIRILAFKIKHTKCGPPNHKGNKKFMTIRVFLIIIFF
jgi:hypothetical protein